jgi:hypothetical protein
MLNNWLTVEAESEQCCFSLCLLFDKLKLHKISRQITVNEIVHREI